MAYKSPYEGKTITGVKLPKVTKKKVVSPYQGKTITGVKLNTPTTPQKNRITANPLNVAALSEGYKGFGTGQGNAAFEKAAAESLQKTINTRSGTNYTPYQVAGAIRAGDTNIPGLASGNLQIPKTDTKKEFDYNAEVQKGIQSYISGLPKIPEYQPYQGGLDPQIMETLNKIKNYQQFSYDPANDPALQQAQTQAIERVRADMARRGRVFDPYAAQQEQTAAQGLIPDYYRFARQGYESDRGYQGQVLGALQGVDQAQFGRYGSEYDRARQGALQGQQDYKTAFDVGQRGAEGEYRRGLTERTYQDQQEQEIRNREIAEFGTPLSNYAREQRQVFLDMPAQIKAQLQELGNQPGGFATTINQLMKTDPTNPMIQQLQAMRANKVLSDPELLSRYGREYGMETGAIGAMGEAAEQQRTKQIQQKVLNELEVMKEKLQNRKYINEISEIQAQVQKIESETAYKDAQVITESYKALQEQIKALAMPEQLKKSIDKTISEISANYSRGRASEASAASSRASAGLSGQRAITEEATRQGKIDIQGQQKVKLQKEIDKVKKESINEVGIGLQDLYDTYNGDINEFLRNEGSVYNPQEIESIVNAHTKIVNASDSY